MSDFIRREQPVDGDEASIALGWLAFHRDALRAKCEGLGPEQLTERAADPSRLSLLGIVRHLAEMERAYGSWPAGPKSEFAWVWGTYEDDAEDDIDCTPADVPISLDTWQAQMTETDQALTGRNLGDVSVNNNQSIRWNVAKLVGEYARHNGHADIIRERIDGATGE